MTSRNNLEVGASPLNLSLTGSQFNQIKNNRVNNNKKPPAPSSYRSYISTSTSNLHADVRKGSNSNRDNNSARQINTNSKKTKPLINPYIKKNEEKENQNSKTRESNIFAPMSVRSSTEETIDTKKSSNNTALSNNSSKVDDLDFFFNMISSRQSNTKNNQLNKESDNLLESERSEYNMIKPLKDEKLIKLKSSVDNLRRELEVETLKNEQENKLLKSQIEAIDAKRRHFAAVKIQKWYRKKLLDHAEYKKELENMFNQKRIEMKKKLEKDIIRSSSNFSNKKPAYRNTHSNKTSNIISNKITQKNIESISPRKIDKQEEKINLNQDLRLNLDGSVNQKEIEKQMSSTNNTTTTVESLLESLDKIDKESSNLLSLPPKGGLDSTRTNDKINSILSYLDEAAAATANNSINYVPRSTNPNIEYELDLEITNFQNTQTKPQTSKSQSISDKEKLNNKNSVEKSISTNNKQTNRPTSSTGVRSSRVIKKQQKEDNNDEINEGENELTMREMDAKLKNYEEKVKNSISKVELNDSILTLKLEIEEKARTIAMLEKNLHQQRELNIRYTKEADKELNIRLETQKNDYEATINRHLGLIDQLIDDKKVLTEKVDQLLKEIKEMEKKYTDKLRTTEERFKYEIQKMKDTFEAAEKIRREKWIEEKTKKIKEMTVKGLEPEIQSLITKHKNEIKSLKAVHDAELLQADERAAQRYIRITEELRENFEREKEASIQKEKDLCKQRYEKSLEEEEKSFLEQRRRLYAEVEEEKNRIAEQAALQRRELDRLRKMLEENNFNSIETIRKEYQTAQAELERKHQSEIESLKETLKIEKESWEQNYMKKQENWIIQKERELKEHVKKDRDKEIEMLIQRLEAESTTAREEVERAAENRIKRIRDKYETELREVEKTERETMERYNSIKSKYNELEGEHERLKVILKQKEKDFEGIKKLTDTLQDERNRLADVIRQDFTDRIVFTEEENKRIKLEIAELKSRHQFELDKKKDEFEKMQKEKEAELNTVHEKIKNVLAKKDETYEQLKKQYEAAAKRADHLEGLLEQQRTLMIKKQANNNN